MDTVYGQVVLGPPGAGKTTYCDGVYQFLTAAGRKTCVINLDPANDAIPYHVDINVMELISLEDVMDATELGPNGGLIYCMEFLDKNFDWIEQRMLAYPGHYFLIDCPGQAELFTHHTALDAVLKRFHKFGLRLAAVHLIDSQHCLDAANFIAMALFSLAAMMRLELPHVNLLSKSDRLASLGRLPFPVDFYTDLVDVAALADWIGVNPEDVDAKLDAHDTAERERGTGDSASDVSPSDCESDDADDDDGAGVRRRRRPLTFLHKYRKLHRAISEVIQDYNLVGFIPFSVMDKTSVAHVLRHVDKSNGFAYSGQDVSGSVAAASTDTLDAMRVADLDEAVLAARLLGPKH